MAAVPPPAGPPRQVRTPPRRPPRGRSATGAAGPPAAQPPPQAPAPAAPAPAPGRPLRCARSGRGAAGAEASVALWADSTYGYLEAGQVMGFAADMGFPLASFTCTYGAGLATRGDESACAARSAARVVVIEMGYNDDSGLSADEAAKRMRKQDWFATLSKDATAVERVIFIAQPGYRQVAGAARKRKKSASSFVSGQLIEGSTWTTNAARLVREELGIEAIVFDAPAEEIYAGFIRDEAGTLWQDKTRCRSYTSHGIEYSEDGSPALWCDAQHPSASGAEAHFRLLAEALKKRFGDFFD